MRRGGGRVGYGLIGFGPVQPTSFNGIAIAAVPFVAALLVSLPLLRSVRDLAKTSRESLRAVLLCVTPAAVGIPSLGAVRLFVEDQVIFGWPFFVFFIHLGYAGVLLLCVMTVHSSSALYSQHISHRYDQMLTWTDGIVKGLFVVWLLTFLCFLASIGSFLFLYPLVVLVTSVHFALLYRTTGKVDTGSEQAEAEMCATD